MLRCPPLKQLEEHADWWRQMASRSSLYRQVVRVWNEFARNLTELPVNARFICKFELYSWWKFNREMHI